MTKRPPDSSALDAAAARQREALQEVTAHHDAESDRLLVLVRKTEEAIRQIAALEMQALRQDELHARLEEELSSLGKRRAETDRAVQALTQERDRSQAELSGAEQARGRLEGEVQQRLQSVKGLVKEHDELQREVEKLDTRRARMEESVQGLRRAREEYLAKIETLKAHHDALLK